MEKALLGHHDLSPLRNIIHGPQEPLTPVRVCQKRIGFIRFGDGDFDLTMRKGCLDALDECRVELICIEEERRRHALTVARRGLKTSRRSVTLLWPEPEAHGTSSAAGGTRGVRRQRAGGGGEGR